MIYALTEEEEPRLVLIKEYRYPLDEEIYALPAGLVDAKETPGMAAVREMKEETGGQFLYRVYFFHPLPCSLHITN